MKQYYAWFERLSDEGKLKSGNQLAPEGKVLSGRKGVTEGPFAESKEGVAGYWFIQAASLDEAVEIAKGDPLLDYGHTIESGPPSNPPPFDHHSLLNVPLIKRLEDRVSIGDQFTLLANQFVKAHAPRQKAAWNSVLHWCIRQIGTCDPSFSPELFSQQFTQANRSYWRSQYENNREQILLRRRQRRALRRRPASQNGTTQQPTGQA